MDQNNLPAKTSSDDSHFEWNEPKMMAVTYLLKGMKVKDVAERVGVSPDAIYDWKKKKAFLDALQFAREETRIRINDSLAEGIEEAVVKTRQLMESGTNRQRVQLDAALGLLKFAPQIFAREEEANGGGREVKIIVMNNTTIENRKPEIQAWEKEMGYDAVIPERLNRLNTDE